MHQASVPREFVRCVELWYVTPAKTADIWRRTGALWGEDVVFQRRFANSLKNEKLLMSWIEGGWIVDMGTDACLHEARGSFFSLNDFWARALQAGTQPPEPQPRSARLPTGVWTEQMGCDSSCRGSSAALG